SELCLIAPAAAVFCLVSSQTAFSIHPRYVLPAFPFLFIWVSRCARSFCFHSIPVATMASFCVIWTLASSLWIYPHSLSYFNESVGGPKNGHRHFVDSASAWGQDVLFLKKWYDAHPEASPLQVASFGWVDPQIAGIRYALPALAPVEPGNYGNNVAEALGPKPGWYAIDVNYLQGTVWDAPDGTGGRRNFWMNFGKPVPDFTYFQRFKPIGTVAYSYRVYHITLSEANCVRRELGLPALTDGTPLVLGGTD
ncbi:MAG: hypothetical protein O7C59_09380, partial [Rickettsia endosymbiont of Ixodes persulcatus]|nr:hypothetical protein [Rickettsia endosymbiont of Ixodes persulcatus]